VATQQISFWTTSSASSGSSTEDEKDYNTWYIVGRALIGVGSIVGGIMLLMRRKEIDREARQVVRTSQLTLIAGEEVKEGFDEATCILCVRRLVFLTLSLSTLLSPHIAKKCRKETG
jgi:hypothetical protein